MPATIETEPATPLPNPELNVSKRDAVRAMFAEIAPSYYRLNHVLSINVDKVWRRFTVKKLLDVLDRPDAIALDLCCGTGDLTLELERHARVVGCDFCHPMLVIGNRKIAAQGANNARLAEGDALQLPFPDQAFDLVVSAFGFRNLTNYDAGLREIYRVLRPKGQVGILDVNEPGGLLGKVYGFYFKNVLPRIGTMISGVRGPYSYLPASVARFPGPEQMLERMRANGYHSVNWQSYTFGIAGLYRGRKK